MPALTVVVPVLAVAAIVGTSPFVETNSTVSPGNNFDWGPNTCLYIRNTTVGALDVIFEAHLAGAERTVAQVTVQGSATGHGVRILGPFPLSYTDHAGSDVGKVYVRQATGSNGQLVFCPFVIRPGGQ